MDSSPPGDQANRTLTWIVCVLIAALAFVYVFITFRGLDSARSMDQAQVARELARGHGFRTLLVRPAALQGVIASGKDPTLTAQQDSYSPPLQPLLLAPVFKYLETWWPFDVTRTVYALDRVVAGVGVFWLLLTLLLVHGMARRLFDRTIAGITVLAVALSPEMWHTATCGGSRSLLLFLFMLAIYWLAAMMRRALAGEPVGFGLVFGIGLACGLMVMTHWMAIWLVLGIMLAIAVLLPGKRLSLVVIALFPVLMMGGWALHLQKVSGTFLGATQATLQSVMTPQDEASHLRDFENVAPPVNLDVLVRKLGINIHGQMQELYNHLGGVVPALLFFLCLLHRFRRPEVQAMRWALVIIWGTAWFGMAMFGLPNKSVDDNQIHCVFIPALAVFGLAALAVFWARMHPGRTGLWTLHGYAVIVLLITAWPMLTGLPSDLKTGLFLKNQLMNWPPYRPITTCYLGKWVGPEEMLASDAPWCIAWYADRTCLWLPKDRAQFESIRQLSENQGHHFAGIVITPLANADNVGGVPFSGSYGAWADWIARGPVLGLGPDLAAAIKPLQTFPAPQSLGSPPLPDGRSIPSLIFFADSAARLPRKQEGK